MKTKQLKIQATHELGEQLEDGTIKIHEKGILTEEDAQEQIDVWWKKYVEEAPTAVGAIWDCEPGRVLITAHSDKIKVKGKFKCKIICIEGIEDDEELPGSPSGYN